MINMEETVVSPIVLKVCVVFQLSLILSRNYYTIMLSIAHSYTHILPYFTSGRTLCGRFVLASLVKFACVAQRNFLSVVTVPGWTVKI